jgi:septal ring factor EnvC (AmiA/AmiB activator)
MPDKAKRIFRHSHLTDFSHAIMDWIGSVPSLLVHTGLFVGSFSLIVFGVNADHVLLVLTTVVSLEAIYMAIFIQMAINLNSKSLDEVEEDLDEIQEEVDEIQKDLDELQEDVEEIHKDVEEVEKVDLAAESAELQNRMVLSKIESQLQLLLAEISRIKGVNP